jgi:hypothetical protein
MGRHHRIGMMVSPALALRSLQQTNPGALEAPGANISFEEEEDS